MFLSKLKIWNFRKYGTKENEDAGITVLFSDRLNLIVGENDSGKTAIIDAIKLVLGTQSYDSVRLEENDFYRGKNGIRTNYLKIECTFESLSNIEAGRFLEWIYIDDEGNAKLEVRLTARIKDNKITIRKTGGKEDLDVNFEASENLRVTYLKPLRDAEHELNPGYRSRFAQVLKSHPIFKNKDGTHKIEEIMKSANRNIEEYFKESISQDNNHDMDSDTTEEIKVQLDYKDNPSSIISSISDTLSNFLGTDKDKYDVNINISEMELNKILSRLMLKIDEDKVGLGTLNQLYMAMEMLLLDIKEKSNEFGLALIEEIEAHIHPQAQLRIIKHLEENIKSQTILTTHSITLASIANLNSLILCRNNNAYSLNNKYTRLSSGDYEFLERFLDSTKANLFFAKGVIMVEGDAENILIPTIAKIIEKPLYMHGVSIVNVGNVAFLRYSNIFISKEGDKTIGIPTSIVTDLDVRPIQYYQDDDNNSEFKGYKIYKTNDFDEYFTKEDDAKQRVKEILGKEKSERFKKGEYQAQIEVVDNDYEKFKEIIKAEKEEKYNFKDIKAFTNNWTMEFDLALSCIKEYLYAAVLIAKDIKLDEGVVDSIDINKYIDKAKEGIDESIGDGKDEMDIAYKIYKPLLKGNASKAVCAQYLSKILLNKSNEDNDLVSKILEDEHIKYILDSIYHVTNSRSEVTE
ncbi:ATP-dependent nuclease [Clostridium frigidicarnis]|uniref:Putative ATP-dependent endonuclease of the OLD family n=1 Tax=Clostridium frigidicarnis TaxID=84698 RepID=A0A1I0X824_9CLOT|nr:AAA family ATPase [Clostridium frigidicarnis]SFA96153.1 putative ATP-dependent endonuclease of the OLD family [Clostridium frigidicarnis]